MSRTTSEAHNTARDPYNTQTVLTYKLDLYSSRGSLKALQASWPPAGPSSTRDPLREPFDDTTVAQPLLFKRMPDQHLHASCILVAIAAIATETRQTHARNGHERHRPRRVVRQTFVRDIRPPRVVE